MKLSYLFTISLVFTLYSVSQAQLYNKNLYSLEGISDGSSIFNIFEFTSKQSNNASINTNGQQIISILDGYYNNTQSRYVVYLENNSTYTLGAIDFNSGSFITIAPFNIPSDFTTQNIVSSSLKFDPVAQELYFIAKLQGTTHMVICYASSTPARVADTKLILPGFTSAAYDVIEKEYFIFAIVSAQYFVAQVDLQTQVVTSSTTFNVRWHILDTFSSKLIAYGGKSYIVELNPSSLYTVATVYQTVQNTLQPITNINYGWGSQFNINTAFIDVNFVYFIASSTDQVNSVLTAYSFEYHNQNIFKFPFKVDVPESVFIQ